MRPLLSTRPGSRRRRDRLRVAILLVAVSASPACALAASRGPGHPLVQNGSFEEGYAGAPSSWIVDAVPRAGRTSSVALDSTRAREGRTSLRIETTGKGVATVSSAAFPVEAGARYLLSLAYRAEGMAVRPGHYAGVAARIDVVWSGSGGEIDHDGIDAPYRNLDWDRFLHLVEAPGGASTATVRIALTDDGGSPATPTRIWIDGVRLRKWATHPLPHAREWTWYAGDFDVHRADTGFHPVADEEATKGRSVVANPAHHSPNRPLFYLSRFEDLPPGAYRAAFRMKGGPGESPRPVAAARVFLGRDAIHLAGGMLSAKEFAEPRTYRTFSVPFVRPPGEAMILSVDWFGGIPVWVDSVTIVEEQLERPGDFSDILAP